MKKQKKLEEGLLFNILFRVFNKSLIKNKIYSGVLMLLGYISVLLSEGDATAFVLTLLLGIPVFFADRNVIE